MLAQASCGRCRVLLRAAHSEKSDRPRAETGTGWLRSAISPDWSISACALASAAAIVPIELTGPLHDCPPRSSRSKLMAPDFERLARMPWPIASLASSGIRPLSSILAFSCSRKAERVDRNTPANSAQALEALMSTMRTASIRGLGGSTPKSRGGSPLSTQRQNFFSAVTRRC